MAMKIKQILTMDMRLSLYQTAMNNAGRNFEGKGVAVKKLAEFASEFYKFSVKEIEILGELNIKQLERTFIKEPVKKVVKAKEFKKLLKKGKRKK